MKSRSKEKAGAKKAPAKKASSKKAKDAPPPKAYRKKAEKKPAKEPRASKGTLSAEEEVSIETSLGERPARSRPILGLVLAMVGVLFVVSLISYVPGQDYFGRVNAEGEGGPLAFLSRSTEALDNGNPVGPLGATLSALAFHTFGVVAWLIPAFLLWAGGLCLFKRAQYLRWWIWALMIPALGACAGVASLAQDPDTVGLSDVFIEGWGGLVGTALHERFLESVLGPVGSGLVLVTLSIAFLTAIFIERPAHAWDRLQHSLKNKGAGYAATRAERKEARRREKEARAQQKEVESAEGEAEAAEGELPLLRRPGTRPAVEAPPPPGVSLSRPGFSSNEERRQAKRRGLTLREQEEAAEAGTGAEEPPSAATGEEEAQASAKGGRKKLKLDYVAPPQADEGLKVIAGERVERAEGAVPERRGDHVFPPLDLLSEPEEVPPEDAEDHRATADLLVKILDQFGVRVEPSEVHAGPVITRYEVKPAAGVRVEKIENLDKNIALGLKATAVRILAPVPGKGTVGVEVPNRRPSPVCLREIVESRAWAESKAEIPIVLGKEVTGKPVVTDLTKMPHLLIAGATGAGKTVCINTVVASLLYHSGPEDLRFIMVDPKIVEMQVFNSLPHMLIPVVTQPKKVPGALKWLIAEMERRYQIFAEVGARNIAGFNAKVLKDREEKVKAEAMDAELSPEERAALGSYQVERDPDVEIPDHKLPYIVCIIDELADLMMVAPADVEQGIARLAQLARAAGIHLIIATQRPSVNVITGVIKANLPSRIAFKVASKVDSRTILDGQGADKLIGKGDMLFLPPGTAQMVRAQGAFVSDEEINAIVEQQKVNGPPRFAEDVQAQVDAEGDDDAPPKPGSDRAWEDDMVPDALEVLRVSKRASTSMLQRRLKIGYNRAARIMEILEKEGIVGPENGSSPREILQDIELM
jgi:S-DNA-T family DNA segregation ATPase FtsK/SpoIIIE